MLEQSVKMRAGKYKIPVTLIYNKNRIFLKFGFNRALMAEIKLMRGPKYHGYDPNPRKIWSVKDCSGNRFQLNYLIGNNPYAKYEKGYNAITWDRPLYKHQLTMISHALTYKHVIFASEMGTGKTLAAIEIMEHINDLEDHEAWYIGPKTGVWAVGLELDKWKSKIRPKMYTYQGLVKIVREWPGDEVAPKIIIFDESSKIKTPTAQRSQAALHVAEAIRKEHGENGYIILMSGTPAPKAPTDWWHQCEVACPGFLKEGNIHKFKQRLCIIEEKQSIQGGTYPHIVTWLDDKKKCSKCGELKENENHELSYMVDNPYRHDFIESKNEVEYLYERMKGLVLVQFKKDCLDLPEKQYKIINVTPSVDIVRQAKIIRKTGRRAVEILNLLRELSDGFLYNEAPDGVIICPNCRGDKELETYNLKEEYLDVVSGYTEDMYETVITNCDYCGGKGEVTKYIRVTNEFGTPKDDVFKKLLGEHEECGRFIVWGGFQGTIDRLMLIAKSQSWDILKVDGRGYIAEDPHGEKLSPTTLLKAMDLSHPEYSDLYSQYPKICFVGHPQAGGMALTLTASPTELFYSNSYSGEARMQAEDRFHRAGMDKNRGCTIIDLLHLPTDKLVLDNLRKKKRLQSITMGEIDGVFDSKEVEK